MNVISLFFLFLVEAVHAPARARLSRDEIIRMLFREGYPYQLILCFLVAIFGIIISLRTLKLSLRRQHLRRRHVDTDLQAAGRCLMVCHCDLQQTFRYAVQSCRLSSVSLVVYLATVPCIRGC